MTCGVGWEQWEAGVTLRCTAGAQQAGVPAENCIEGAWQRRYAARWFLR